MSRHLYELAAQRLAQRRGVLFAALAARARGRRLRGRLEPTLARRAACGRGSNNTQKTR